MATANPSLSNRTPTSNGAASNISAFACSRVSMARAPWTICRAMRSEKSYGDWAGLFCLADWIRGTGYGIGATSRSCRLVRTRLRAEFDTVENLRKRQFDADLGEIQNHVETLIHNDTAEVLVFDWGDQFASQVVFDGDQVPLECCARHIIPRYRLRIVSLSQRQPSFST